MARSKVVDYDYYQFLHLLQRATDAGARIERSDPRWKEYVDNMPSMRWRRRRSRGRSSKARSPSSSPKASPPTDYISMRKMTNVACGSCRSSDAPSALTPGQT